MKKIKFITDSVADIPQDIRDRWGIEMVPAYVNYGGQSYADDGIQLDRKQYFDDMLAMPEPPTTAAPPPEIAREVVRRAFVDADHVIAVTTSQQMSGIYNAVRIALEDYPPDQVTLIDSEMLGLGIGYPVIVGAEVAAATGSVEETIDAIHRVKQNVYMYALAGSMEMIKRSGRVSWAAGYIGTLLQIKPLIRVGDGAVSSVALVRSYQRGLRKMSEIIRQHGPFERMGLVHSNNLEAVETLRADLADILPDDLIVHVVNPALGTHVGPQSVAVIGLNPGWKA